MDPAHRTLLLVKLPEPATPRPDTLAGSAKLHPPSACCR